MNQVNNNLKQLKALYNQSWTRTLTQQREDFGDLEASLQFIKKLDIPKEAKILEIGCAIGKLCKPNPFRNRQFIITDFKPNSMN